MAIALGVKSFSFTQPNVTEISTIIEHCCSRAALRAEKLHRKSSKEFHFRLLKRFCHSNYVHPFLFGSCCELAV